MPRSTMLAAVLLALAGAALAAPNHAQHAKATPKPVACVPDAASFWKDQALTTKVAATLPFHQALMREKIDVKVTGSAAMLSGNVSSQAAIAEAVKVAAGVSGVKCVQNFLRVGPPLVETPQQP